jgi:asparagine synthase (glutamine-hydrolysing)
MSGGLDSSSIVGVVRNDFRAELERPLQTYSLVREDRENCPEWSAVQEMIAGGWIDATVITPAAAGPTAAQDFLTGIAHTDDPFELVGCFPVFLAFQAAKQSGARVLLEGMGGDLLFYSPGTSQRVIAGRRMLGLIPQLIAAQRRHKSGLEVWRLPWQLLAETVPEGLRALYRSLRHRDPSRPHMGAEIGGDHFRRMRPEVRARFLESKRQSLCNPRYPRPLKSDQAFHAFHFSAAMLSAGHEWEGELASTMGLEQRSPYSDQRMIEFGIRMPVQAKVAAPWYKPMLRSALAGILPPRVTWREDLGNHPGFQYQARLLTTVQQTRPELLRMDTIEKILGAWIDPQALRQTLGSALRPGSLTLGYNLLSLAFLAKWIDTRF